MGPVGTETTRAGDGQLVQKNTARLADGREIIYFDETPGLNRALARDLREGLSPGPAPGTWSPEQAVRWDPLLGEWVIIAAQRQERTGHRPPTGARAAIGLHRQAFTVPADSYTGRLNRSPLAGTESGMAVWVNDIVPETAARRLREA